MDTTPSMAVRPWTEWLRTYRGHGRAGGPLEGLGTADITTEVAVDQLAAVRPPDDDRSQAEFLRPTASTSWPTRRERRGWNGPPSATSRR